MPHPAGTPPNSAARPVANIGRTQQRWRLIAGLAGLAVTVVLMGVVMSAHLARVWRATLFVPILFSAICFLQVRAQTCVALAAQGHCHFDAGGATPVADPHQREASRAEARRIVVHAVLSAALLTVLILFVM